MKKNRIILLEDHPEYADELKRMVQKIPHLEWVKTFSNPVQFLCELPGLDADIAFVDIQLPKMSGIECVKPIRQVLPNCQVIMLTIFDDEDLILQAFLEGACGYLLKDSKPSQIIEAIEDALDGGAPMTPRIARKVVKLLGSVRDLEIGVATASGQDKRPSTSELPLSPREMEILHLLAEGKKYLEIAEALYISMPTVKTHIKHIYEKLSVRNKTEAISRLLNIQ